MHQNNLHNKSYDFDLLSEIHNELKPFIFSNKYGTKTITFSNSEAVKALNKALLQVHYGISFWDFPDKNLCPPIPSRVDYIHHLKDLIGQKKDVKVLDIGTGATCIYPLLGNSVYNWSFVGTDIDTVSVQIASEIIGKNNLNSKISVRLQNDKAQILKGIINADDFFDIVMCNPPFFKSEKEALEANALKNKNLKITTTQRNFSGNNNELWYVGGEKAFLHNYLFESSLFKKQCTWFTSLVSKKDNVKSMYTSLKKLKVISIKTIEMSQGNKITRIVAWRFS